MTPEATVDRTVIQGGFSAEQWGSPTWKQRQTDQEMQKKINI